MPTCPGQALVAYSLLDARPLSRKPRHPLRCGSSRSYGSMKDLSDSGPNKVPALTVSFWIVKIAATTLGGTRGDVVSMSMNLGYLLGTGIFVVIFLIAVAAQI